MDKKQKVAVIVWTVDPEGKKRYLLRHNKPFNGYKDEWTITFGTVENNEELLACAKREVAEEFGVNPTQEIQDLNYKVEFEGNNGLIETHFLAIRVESLDVRIILNEESIGYDWMLLETVLQVMKLDNEKEAFKLLDSKT